MLESFLSEQTQKIVKTYKISAEEARGILQNKLDKLPLFKNAIVNAESLKSIYRTREYKDFIKKTKKDIYYQLRTYQTPSDELISSHLSTKERAPYVYSFFEQLNPCLEDISYVLDIGGGLFPLSIDINILINFQEYVWIDKDVNSFEKLNDYKNSNSLKHLKLYNHHLGQETWSSYLPEEVNQFDLAFMLKLVPVIYRQEKELLEILADVPAETILVTGSKEAMVKKENIERRERSIIKKFISNTQREIISEIDIPNEFGYLIK